MSEVFISYSRAKASEARRIAEALHACGFSTWQDEELPPHRPYTEVTQERLDESRAVLVLWSEEAVHSQWVRSEADRGRQSKKLVQVSLDGAFPPMPFDQIQCADLTGWTGDLAAPTWRRVQQSLAALAGARAADRPSPAASAIPVLAVLPFDNLSSDAEMGWFSDGVSEEILQTVARQSDLKVIGRSSSFQFRGAEKSARKVAAELGATHLLDGSVRRSGQRVRISAQLVECAAQTTAWSDRFDRELTDIFALQDEIAAAVAAALQRALRPGPARGQVDPAAYDLYLRARSSNDQWLGGADESLLEQALELAPDFAAAWATLALTRAIKAQVGAPSDDFAHARAQAEAAAERALALDPKAGTAYAALSFLQPVCGALREREALIEKALAASPEDPRVLFHAARFMQTVGRMRAGLEISRRIRDLDPLWPQGANQYASLLLNCGLKAEGEAAYDRALERWPDLPYTNVAPLMRALLGEDWPRADRLLEIVRTRGPKTPQVEDALRQAERLRRMDEADLRGQLARQAQRVEAGGMATFNIGLFCRYGLADEAYDQVERSSYAPLFEGERPPGRAFGLHDLFTEPFVEMRADPRFVRLCGKLSLVDYWLASDRWPDCADEVPYDFRAECRRWAAENPR